MDSLTQIVLGASMAEAVAGKKIGNKAMLWGAVAGTIPDLDVFGGLLGMSADDALAFHRAISHSIFFAVLAPLLLAGYTYWLYGKNHHKKQGLKWTTAIAGILFLFFASLILNLIPYVITESISFVMLPITILGVGYFGYRLVTNYVKKEQESVNMSYGHWYLLFFVAILTHPILDCCTGYGTQLFQPFSDMRLAWNNISVADPLYTFPFLLFLVLSATRRKENRWRSILNYIGIAWSLLYMAWTVRNKYIVDQVFTESLQNQEINYSRYMTTPAILNNVLWHCVAEGDEVYYDGYYSLLDAKNEVKLQEIEKNHHLITNYEDKRVKTLKWFTNDYFSVMELENDTLQFNDLRYGAQIGADINNPSQYIFSFNLYKSGEDYIMVDHSKKPPSDDMGAFWNTLWSRVMGVE